MSYNLTIWETPVHWKTPAKLQEAAKHLQALEQTLASINPALQELARQLAALYPSMDSPGEDARDAVWISNPVKDVEAMERAVWVLGLPDEDRVTVLCHVVEIANMLGLTVLDDQMGMVFLPGGKVLPANKRALWEGVKAHVRNAPPVKVTKAQLRKKMLEIFTPRLIKHGFKLDAAILKTDQYKTQDYFAVRQVQGGEQIIFGSLKGEPSEFRFVIFCEMTNFQAKQIAKEILNEFDMWGGGVSIAPEWFTGNHHRGVPVNTDEEIGQAMALFEDKVMPVLDMASDIKGLDRVMNDTTLVRRVPPYPGHSDNYSSYIRSKGIAPLTIARLAGNPQFDEIVKYYEDLNEKIYDPAKANEIVGRFVVDDKFVEPTHAERHEQRVARLAKLVKYLREEVKPVV